MTLLAAACFVSAQERRDAVPVIVQPGAPGQPTKILPPDTRLKLPPHSAKNVEFMQGMIMHHAQAVEMTAMIASRTEDVQVKLMGERISKSQSDEIEMMQKWLKARGESTEMKMSGHDHGGHGSHSMTMPGMLTKDQMDELRESTGAKFDRLFLTGMIQHHKGALVMVDELFKSPGAGQDAELFNFASDVDSGQRAEIRSMELLLQRNP